MNDMNSHWTQDEERLEQYVLGQIPGKERLLLERHLQMCRECAMRVQNEEAMKQAIRLEGRTQLKSDLRSRVTGTRHVSPFDWRWAAAAAIIVGIGFWYVNKGSDPAPLSDGQIAERQTQPDTTPAVREAAGGGERPADQFADSRQTEADRPLLRPGRTDAASSASGAGQMQQRDAEAELGRERPTEDLIGALEEMPLATGDDASTEDVWVVAIVVDDESVMKDKIEVTAPRRRLALRSSPEAAQATQTAKKAEGKVASDEKQDRQKQSISLLQESQRKLSPTQQQTLAKEGVHTIPAKLRQQGDTLQVTLYPDPPIRQSRLNQATFIQQSVDTLLIVLESQRIVVPLPAAVQKK